MNILIVCFHYNRQAGGSKFAHKVKPGLVWKGQKRIRAPAISTLIKKEWKLFPLTSLHNGFSLFSPSSERNYKLSRFNGRRRRRLRSCKVKPNLVRLKGRLNDLMLLPERARVWERDNKVIIDSHSHWTTFFASSQKHFFLQTFSFFLSRKTNKIFAFSHRFQKWDQKRKLVFTILITRMSWKKVGSISDNCNWGCKFSSIHFRSSTTFWGMGRPKMKDFLLSSSKSCSKVSLKYWISSGETRSKFGLKSFDDRFGSSV